MAASNETAVTAGAVSWRWLGLAILGSGLLWLFPLFHVLPLRTPEPAATAGGGEFNAVAAAKQAWDKQILPAAAHAEELRTFATELRRDPIGTAKRRGHEVGLGGAAYFFVRGTGRVVARSEDDVRIALDGADGVVVSLATGALFGNTIRDGCGLLNVNRFPGLDEFNALSAELNALAEAQVAPVLRERAVIGATVAFAGCAPAPEVADANPLLAIVPVSAVVNR